MTMPVSGFYNTVMGSYFGDLSQNEQQKLWDLFLQNNNLTTAPSSSDPAMQAQFVHFAIGMYARANEVQSQVALPPTEVAKRKILSDTIDIVLQMLNVVQQTVGEQAQLLLFVGKWQQEYTKMISRVPIYLPSPANTWKPDATDASRFTLGFNNISIKEVSEYVVSTNSTIQLSNGLMTFTLSTNSCTFSSGLITQTTTNTPTSDTFDAKVAATSKAFLDIYNDPSLQPAITANSNSFFGTPRLPWRFVAINVPAGNEDARKQNDAITSNRGEANARLQGVIENIRSKKQILQDLSGSYQTTVTESREKISQLSDLLTSLLEALKEVMQAIAK